MNAPEFLIQHPDDSKFHFGWEDGQAGWTADLAWAIRSETRAEAEEFAGNIGLSDWKVVEEPSSATSKKSGGSE